MAIKASDNFKVYKNPNEADISTVKRPILEADDKAVCISPNDVPSFDNYCKLNFGMRYEYGITSL